MSRKKAAPNSDDAEAKREGLLLPIPEAAREFHERQLRSRLETWGASGKIPSALLLTGSAGIGKRSMAHWLAQWILCEPNGHAGAGEDEGPGLFGEVSTPSPASASVVETTSLRPCGRCPSCTRMLAGSNVNFIEIRPEAEEGKEESATLKVEQFRDLKHSAGRGGFESTYKVIAIPRAQGMTPQAANSLLKLLEEPPRGWIFLLTTNDPTLVLPTILSRCQQVRLAPLPFVALVELLRGEGVKPDRAEAAARLAQGSWKRAAALALDEAWEKRKEIAQFLKTPSASLSPLVEWASAGPDPFLFLVDTLEGVLVDLLKERRGLGDGWLNADLANGLKGLSGRLPEAFFVDRIERLARSRREVLAPLNRKLLVQDVLMPFLSPR